MGDVMQFPDDINEFIKQYSIKDRKELYTNGSILIPAFRVGQMVEHYFNVELDERNWLRTK